MDEEYQETYEEPYDEPYDMYPCQAATSSCQGNKFKVITQQSLFQQIIKLVNKTNQTVNMDFGWCFLLLREFNWQEGGVGDYFQKMDAYKKKIGYDNALLTPQKASEAQGTQQCLICYERKPVIMNICRHKFCKNCWVSHISQQLTNMNPFMRCMGCQKPLLYETITKIINNNEFSKIYTRYIKQICEFFANTSKIYQCCPGVDCKYCIECDNYLVTSVKCNCGKMFCFRCKNDDHSPCTCDERMRWINIVLKEQANAKWISTYAKFCPWCNKAVERSQGCNFMACICGKSFCYMCSKPWEPDHKDHFKCHIFKKDDAASMANKVKAALEKINFYAQKYINTNGIIDELRKVDIQQKREFLYKKLGIELSESTFINDAYKFAIECCESLKWIYVFSYFVQFVDPRRKQQFLFYQGQYQSYKENLMKKLGYDLKVICDDIVKICGTTQKLNLPDNIKSAKTNEFNRLKKNIVEYYLATKKFQQAFVKELLGIDEKQIKRNDGQEETNNTDNQKNKPKK